MRRTFQPFSFTLGKKRAHEAMAYNALVQSWPEITRLAREKPRAATPGTTDLFDSGS